MSTATNPDSSKISTWQGFKHELDIAMYEALEPIKYFSNILYSSGTGEPTLVPLEVGLVLEVLHKSAVSNIGSVVERFELKSEELNKDGSKD